MYTYVYHINFTLESTLSSNKLLTWSAYDNIFGVYTEIVLLNKYYSSDAKVT